MKIVLATRNKKKIEELRRLVEGMAIEPVGLDQFPACPEVVEDGDTFAANAAKKAHAVARHTGHWALADDSGLVVDALDGAPGVYSARYSGENASDADNSALLLRNLGNAPAARRTARFVCVLTLANPAGGQWQFEGRVEGRIGTQARGHNGFGYDPIFIPEGFHDTFAEMSAAQKDALSHRGRALAAFAAALRDPEGELFSQRLPE